MTAFLLLFALQTIVAPALCAIHDPSSTPAGISDAPSPAASKQTDEFAAVSARLDVQDFGQSRHEDMQQPRCDVPVLPAADTFLPALGVVVIVVDMAPAWQQAVLQATTAGSAVPALGTRFAPPPPQSSLLDIAPRLRI